MDSTVPTTSLTSKPLVFVTGGTGHAGSYLIRYLLAQGEVRVRALHRMGSRFDLLGDDASRVEWVQGTVEDLPMLEVAMQGVDQVYHCAAIISYERRYAQRMFEVNTVGTANVLHAAMSAGVHRMVHFSSIAAIGRTYQRRIYDEKFTWERCNLNTDYAVSKFLAEQEVWRAVAEGFDAVIVSPSVIVGSGFWHHGANRLLRHVWANNPLFPIGGTGYVDVRDVAKFAIKVMKSDIKAERFLVSAENWRYQDTLRLIAELLQKRAPTIPATPILRGIAWRFEWLKSRLLGIKPDITKASARNSARIFEYDNTKSKAFPHQYISIEQSLRETCSQFAENIKNGDKYAILPLV